MPDRTDPMPQPPPSPFPSDDVDALGIPDFLRDPLGLLHRRWCSVLLVLALGLGGTALFVAWKKPRFAAEATVLVTTQRIPESFVRSTITENSLQRLNAMLGSVLSRDTMAGLVEEFDLYRDRRDRETLGEIVARTREDVTIAPVERIGAPSHREAAQLFTIGFEADRPDVAAEVANRLAGALAGASIRARTEQARSTTEFLRGELDRSERELREHNRKITAFRERHRGELPADLDTNLSRLERLQERSQSLALEIAETETRIAMLATQPQARLDERSLEARLAEMRAQLKRELALHTAEHPNVKLLEREVAALEWEWAGASTATGGTTSQAALLDASRRTVQELRAQSAQSEALLAELDARVARIPARAEVLGALEERESVLRENYLEFLRKVQEAELAQNLESAQQGERFSVLDWAQPATQPTKARWKYLAAGVFLSVFLSLGCAVVRELLDPVLLTPIQLEGVTGLPVLGALPRIS